MTLGSNCVPEFTSSSSRASPRRPVFYRDAETLMGRRDVNRTASRKKADGGLTVIRNDDIGEAVRLELFRSQFTIRQAEQRAYDLFLQNLVQGHEPPVARSGGGRSRLRRGDAARRPQLLHLSRPRPHAGARRAGRKGAGRADAARQRPDARQGRLDAPHLRRARRDGLLRHHRRASADRLRRGLAAQYKGHDDVSVCFFGDGTTNIGAFHEALNFAAVWKLPVVFVCENNLYMEYTPIRERDRGRASGRRSRARPMGSSASSSTATTPTRFIGRRRWPSPARAPATARR